MSKKHNIEEIREVFKKCGYSLISNEYINAHTKLETLCHNGHSYFVTFTKWLSGSRCLCENYKHRLTIDYIKSEFEKRNYILLSNSYENNKKLDYICPNGHKHSIRFDHFQKGHGCPYCNGRPIVDIERVRKEFASEDYVLLTSEYKNNFQKLDYICPRGHKHSITRNNWTTGYRCPECAHNMKKTLEFIKDDFNKNGYTLVSNNYINHHQKLHCICPNGHDYYVSWSNWQQHNSRCPKCKDWGTSSQESTLLEFVRDLCGCIIEHDRILISPYELDIVIPDKKIAIEYCGLYWHSQLAGKNQNYHLNKLTSCESRGYRLMTIFEDELVFNRDIVFSRLKNIFNYGDSKIIYARNCIVKEITTEEAINFCNTNHIQGYGSGTNIKLGAFFNDELVSVMTFSKPSVAKGRKNTDLDAIWELHRFCSKLDYRVIGIASKLLKYFKNNYKWNEIYSYADRRWSIGNVYDKLGFKFDGYIRPNYWYIRDQKRIHRFGLRKRNGEDKFRTEWEIRQEQGWNRIWDCGNIKYVIKKEKGYNC